MEKIIKISDVVKENLQEKYFKKVAMENLIENLGGAENAPDKTLEKYGKVCAEFSDAGTAIINEDGEITNPKRWECEFETNEFKIEY